jgi:peptidyl-prolyl cis-trans isomerase B (cyclophilin B)
MTMKKISIAVATIILATMAAPVSQAADPTPSVAGCKTSTATRHTPATVKQPTAPAKKLPKTLTFSTNCGDIVITLNPKAPQTITNMSVLANAGYFDKSLCHRLTTQGLFVLQCGDPTLTGAGSPTGWKGYADENLPKAGANNYPAGTVAMANSGPATNGSQFFLVYADTQLGPNYTIWGKITKGLDIVKKIGAAGAFTVQDNKSYVVPDGYPIQLVELVKAKAK